MDLARPQIRPCSKSTSSFRPRYINAPLFQNIIQNAHPDPLPSSLSLFIFISIPLSVPPILPKWLQKVPALLLPTTDPAPYQFPKPKPTLRSQSSHLQIPPNSHNPQSPEEKNLVPLSLYFHKRSILVTCIQTRNT